VQGDRPNAALPIFQHSACSEIRFHAFFLHFLSTCIPSLYSPIIDLPFPFSTGRPASQVTLSFLVQVILVWICTATESPFATPNAPRRRASHPPSKVRVQDTPYADLASVQTRTHALSAVLSANVMMDHPHRVPMTVQL
jgi:hypothetical protein